MEFKIILLFIVLFAVNYPFYLWRRKKAKRFYAVIENLEYNHYPKIPSKTYGYGYLSMSFLRRKVDVFIINNDLVLINGFSIIQFSKNKNTLVYHGVTTLMFINNIYVEGAKLKLMATGPNIHSDSVFVELDFAGKNVFLDKIVSKINNVHEI